MCSITPEYLLRITASKNVFNLEKSVIRTVENLKKCECSKDDLKYIFNIARSLRSWCDAEVFYEEIYSIINKYSDSDSDSESEYIVMDYPEEAKIFVLIFMRYLQPILVEELSQLIFKAIE